MGGASGPTHCCYSDILIALLDEYLMLWFWWSYIVWILLDFKGDYHSPGLLHVKRNLQLPSPQKKDKKSQLVNSLVTAGELSLFPSAAVPPA